MKRKATLAFLFALLIFLVSCTSGQTSRTVYTMDTIASFTLMPENTGAADAIEELLFEIEEELSPTDGVLSDLNANGGGEAGPHLKKILELSEKYREETGGAFSPYLGAPIELWGIGEKNYVPTDEKIASVLSSAKAENATLRGEELALQNGVKLNFGAIAKGYATDRIRALLLKEKVKGAVVDLGGNVYVHGARPTGEMFRVALRDPEGRENDWILSLSLSDMFVISSGDYERYFEKEGKKYHHILNPETGKPAESDLAAACVIAADGAMADAYSTALYVMGREGALSFWREHMGFELVLIGRDGVVTVTEGLGQRFIRNENKRYVYEIANR